MLELRLKAEDALGEQFRIKDFHHTVLALGPVPLFTLERVIKDWISSSQEDVKLTEIMYQNTEIMSEHTETMSEHISAPFKYADAA